MAYMYKVQIKVTDLKYNSPTKINSCLKCLANFVVIGVNALVLSSLQGKVKIFLYSSIILLLVWLVCTYYIYA